MSIGWVMFFKALALWLWADFCDWRQRRKKRTEAALLYEEWQRATAKQPRALTDQRTK